MKHRGSHRSAFAIAITALVCGASPAAVGQEHASPADKDAIRAQTGEYSPYVDQHFPNRVLWGDTHLHTSNSADAGFLNDRVGPEEAFRFARGEVVVSTGGLRVKLQRPYDFLVVSDHAEYLGLTPALRKGDPLLLENETGRRWHDLMKKSKEGAFEAAMECVLSINARDEKLKNEAFGRSMWAQNCEIADRFNQPGAFTAFIGFEWTSMPGGRNLHRVVVFRDDRNRATQVVPLSFFDTEDPEDLWKYMEAYERKTGGRMLAIPHNGNLSNGMMFAVNRMNGRKIDAAYARTRSRWEPLVEVTQIKGDGEAHPLLSPDDEFAGYEVWDKGDLTGQQPKKNEMLQYEYARSALKLGLELEQKLGANPFPFGMVGSTDTHTGLSTTAEDNFFGKHSGVEPGPHRWEHIVIQSPVDPKLSIHGWEMAASGLAAVWARENTREAIFDAMFRRETYGTTGTRMTVRVFAGWDFRPEEVNRPDFAAQGYDRGVPMGGDLSAAPSGKAPTLMIRAMRDPDGANLDRIQVIKCWLDAAGKSRERVYDAAVSDGRKIGPDGRCRQAVGTTVDVSDASFQNTIGDAVLGAFWKDPAFDASRRALYYVRVIEIPTPRWTAYEARRYGIQMAANVPMTTQERAYTSPIWYTPGGRKK
jgi:hypothetical protein